jgi:hypothetical protein
MPQAFCNPRNAGAGSTACCNGGWKCIAGGFFAEIGDSHAGMVPRLVSLE